MNILLLERAELEIAATDARVRHVRKILKLSAGDSLRAGIVDGPLGTARIEELNNHHMRISFVADPAEAGDRSAAESSARAPGAAVDLLLGHPRPIVLKRMIRDLCTIGVRRLLVVPTELGEKSYLRASMWANLRPYLLEGAAQAGVTRLTEVSRFTTFADGLAALDPDAPEGRLVLHPGGPSLLTVLGPDGSGAGASSRDLPLTRTLAVGSERGWTEDEVASLEAAGFIRVGLGTRILRTETAALAACWLAVSGGDT